MPQSKLKKAALAFIANSLTTIEERQERDKIFKILDQDGNGTLTKDEVLNGYNQIAKQKLT
jgi:calcium-dependent protein kinase